MLIDDLRAIILDVTECPAADRICDFILAYDALAPDWTTAPEWATRCTIDWKGDRRWTGGDRSRVSEWVDLPIGLDWRLCLWQRPPAQEPGT